MNIQIKIYENYALKGTNIVSSIPDMEKKHEEALQFFVLGF